jgi:hypothetical protein
LLLFPVDFLVFVHGFDNVPALGGRVSCIQAGHKFIYLIEFVIAKIYQGGIAKENILLFLSDADLVSIKLYKSLIIPKPKGREILPRELIVPVV